MARPILQERYDGSNALDVTSERLLNRRTGKTRAHHSVLYFHSAGTIWMHHGMRGIGMCLLLRCLEVLIIETLGVCLWLFSAGLLGCCYGMRGIRLCLAEFGRVRVVMMGRSFVGRRI